MKNLFAYGTLLSEDIFERVTGLRRCRSMGILYNFRRLQVDGEDYPGIMAMEGHNVPGTLYHDLPEAAWGKLDRFEGDMYDRLEVLVEVQNKGQCPAFTYVVRPEYYSCLVDQDWDVETFFAKKKQRFMESHFDFEK